MSNQNKITVSDAAGTTGVRLSAAGTPSVEFFSPGHTRRISIDASGQLVADSVPGGRLLSDELTEADLSAIVDEAVQQGLGSAISAAREDCEAAARRVVGDAEHTFSRRVSELNEAAVQQTAEFERVAGELRGLVGEAESRLAELVQRRLAEVKAEVVATVQDVLDPERAARQRAVAALDSKP